MGTMMEKLLQDVRYGVRMLVKSPSFSIVAIVALALGIGANTAIFSVVNAVLLRPLPFQHSEQLVAVWENDYQRGQERGWFSYPDFEDLRAQSQSFAQLASYHNADFVLTGSGEPVRLQGAVVNAEMFSLLGQAPLLGRSFVSDEDKPEANGRVVILSQELFQKRFNADASLINQSITLDGTQYTVIGVMPREFQFPVQNETVELWTTMAGDASGTEPATSQRGSRYLNLIARLKPGVSLEQAEAEVSTIAKRLEHQYSDTNSHKTFKLEPALHALVGDVRPALLILMGAVACVLLIACANVANLLLTRGLTRHKEIAIRSALGASRLHVVRQLLIESLLLSLAGGALGLLLAFWWTRLLVSLGKDDIPRASQVGLDWRVLGFTLFVSIATGLLFGIVPALHSSRPQLAENLKEGRGSGEGPRRNFTRSVLVVAELAIAVVLLVGAGLLLESLWRLRQVNPGFQPQNVLTFNLALPDVRYSTDQQAVFFHDLVTHIETLPGVQAASVVTPLPLGGDMYSLAYETDGRPLAKKDLPKADFFNVGLGYFRTMGIPFIKGRDFTEGDQHKSVQVIIINETLARERFPNEDPIGKRIKPGFFTYGDEKPAMREIIGVVADVRSRDLRKEARPSVYVPQTQIPFNQMTVVVRTNNDPRTVISAVSKEVAAFDRELPLFTIKTLDEYFSAAIAAPRFNTTLLSLFAAVALVLTIVGLYGVMSYSVAQRTNEIGIRMALGAQSRDVLRLIVGQGLKMVLLGLAIGLIGAAALMRVIASLLFGVTAKDPLTFAAVSLVLAGVALVACYIPARRATQVDPIQALRYE
jgi:putative ABC transport system permease protein